MPEYLASEISGNRFDNPSQELVCMLKMARTMQLNPKCPGHVEIAKKKKKKTKRREGKENSSAKEHETTLIALKLPIRSETPLF